VASDGAVSSLISQSSTAECAEGTQFVTRGRQQSATGEFVLGKMVDASSRESNPKCRPVRPHLRRPLINGGVDRWSQ
jgi:hypothetical protein